MQRFVSDPFDLEGIEQDDISRADLVFYDVAHDGDTYEARVFLDNEAATISTPLTEEAGYAGSFTVFGHGHCYGDEGHCEPRARYTDEFDRRGPHPLEPVTKTVVVTKALRRVPGPTVTVTVVAVDITGRRPRVSDELQFKTLRLAVYDGFGGEQIEGARQRAPG